MDAIFVTVLMEVVIFAKTDLNVYQNVNVEIVIVMVVMDVTSASVI
jgi:hypothetical protein